MLSCKLHLLFELLNKRSSDGIDKLFNVLLFVKLAVFNLVSSRVDVSILRHLICVDIDLVLLFFFQFRGFFFEMCYGPSLAVTLPFNEGEESMVTANRFDVNFVKYIMTTAKLFALLMFVVLLLNRFMIRVL